MHLRCVTNALFPSALPPLPCFSGGFLILTITSSPELNDAVGEFVRKEISKGATCTYAVVRILARVMRTPRESHGHPARWTPPRTYTCAACSVKWKCPTAETTRAR